MQKKKFEKKFNDICKKNMNELNLPHYQFKIKQEGSVSSIFDSIRKKYVALTPEEWVRQNFIQYLITEKKYPESLIGVEVSLKLNTLSKRSDIVLFNRNGLPLMIIECKSTDVQIDQKVFDQVVRYNMIFQAPYIIVTNGLLHFCCKIDYHEQKSFFLKEIPEFSQISDSSCSNDMEA